MKKWYPYRFKTIDEFKDDFGYYWRNDANRSDIFFISSMDYLLGQPYPFDINLDDYDTQLPYIPRLLEPDSTWTIRKFMLTENEKLEPTYKPKEKIVRSL